MEEVRLLLCPHVLMEDIQKRARLILTQMSKPDNNPQVVEQIPLHHIMQCEECGNTEEDNTVYDELTGTRICLGMDGLGCGVVLRDQYMQAPFVSSSDEENVYEMYSPQNTFTVETTRNSHFKRMTQNIEKNLIRYGREDTVTSDAYKDDQRRQVYSLLDHVHLYTTIDIDCINKVKMLFHEYRTKMYRIHKLETAVCCLIFIVIYKLH